VIAFRYQTGGMSIDVERSSMEMTGLIAEEIRALLGRRRMSGRELARKLDVSPSWVSYRLTGTQEIGVNDLALIAQALNVGIVDLLPRDARQPTLTLASEPTVTGRTPWPEHPIVAGAARIPQRRTAVDQGPPGRHSKTYPTGR